VELKTKDGNIFVTKLEAERIKELSKSTLVSISITWRKVEALTKMLEQIAGKNAV